MGERYCPYKLEKNRRYVCRLNPEAEPGPASGLDCPTDAERRNLCAELAAIAMTPHGRANSSYGHNRHPRDL